MAQFDLVTDVVVVGSGSAALTGALAARQGGADVLVLESTDLVGGSSAMSGGGMWIPNNPVNAASGVTDDYDTARTYLDWCVDKDEATYGPVGPASSPARRHAFLTEGPAMVAFLQGLGVRLVHADGYPDYYPEQPGGTAQGRCIEGDRYDLKKLGPVWRNKLRGYVPIPAHTFEFAQINVSFRTWKGFFTAARVIGIHAIGRSLVGQKPAGLGNALMGQLLQQTLERGVKVWTSSPLVELVTEGDAVVGVVAEHEGRRQRIGARHGVLLGGGGFAHNDAMRQKYHEHPITTAWTSANPGDLGLPVQAGVAAGGALALMDDAWWGPTILNPDGSAQFLLAERSLPHGIIVDRSGQRFMNESESYVDAGHHTYQRNRTVEAIPAYLVVDSHHRSRYPFGINLPGMTSKKALESGAIVKADTLDELAAKLGIDAAGLAATVARFNEFARTGKDLDFHRGDSAYDRFYSDPRVKPNPNLGALTKAPFYAARVWPGDLGTKGGLLTDELARVLREDGSAIEGLYAAGNTTASVMGRTYPGPGATIGPAMTFGYVAGRHAAAKSPTPVA